MEAAKLFIDALHDSLQSRDSVAVFARRGMSRWRVEVVLNSKTHRLSQKFSGDDLWQETTWEDFLWAAFGVGIHEIRGAAAMFSDRGSGKYLFRAPASPRKVFAAFLQLCRPLLFAEMDRRAVFPDGYVAPMTSLLPDSRALEKIEAFLNEMVLAATGQQPKWNYIRFRSRKSRLKPAKRLNVTTF